MCDQVNQVDPVHQVNKVDEVHQVHQVDPVHQVNEIDEVHQVKHIFRRLFVGFPKISISFPEVLKLRH